MSNNKQNTATTAPRLFLFCIGGTGARILKSLIFLMASGVDIKASSIIPMIIDPDRSNGDLSRTLSILETYSEVRKYLESSDFKHNSFFKTKIQALTSIDTTQTAGKQGFRFGIDGVLEGKFRDFVDIGLLDSETKLLVEALYTQSELNEVLDVGFKGRPHMGSVVLNKFSESEDFSLFANRIQPNDRIFIASSIFGGTGAAGFPLLVKNIRQPSENLNKINQPEILKKAKLGAITVLPYFAVKPDPHSAVDSGTFISKSKAALEYYHHNITDNKSLNALYYIGDGSRKDEYKNIEGANGQKNKAHIVELLSAMAIVDFMDMSDTSLQTTEDGKAVTPVYKEYGLVGGNQAQVNFNHLGNESRDRMVQPLIQYKYSTHFWDNYLNLDLKDPWAKSFDNTFKQSDFYKRYLSRFNSHFNEWITEMAKNDRAFIPFRDNVGKDFAQIVNDISAKKPGLFSSTRWNDRDFVGYLNDAIKKTNGDKPEVVFMTAFHLATRKICESRLVLN